MAFLLVKIKYTSLMNYQSMVILQKIETKLDKTQKNVNKILKE